ncbi:MAG: DegV family protein [Bacillota bacterium]|jgi:DegV family protein with EDD domain
MKIAVLTDTNSGITAAEAERLGVFTLPMPVLIDGEICFEGKDLTEERFYALLTAGREISTSQPSPGDVMKRWDSLLEQGFDQIVHIPMSSGLSNSCETAAGLAASYEGKVFVADNHRISVTLRESVRTAVSLASAGKNGGEIKAELERTAALSTIYISVNTLEYLKKGGRITPAAAMIGSALGIKPILTIQGEKLDAFSKARTMRKCQQKMIEAVKKDLKTRFPDAEMKDLRVGAAGTMLPDAERDGWLKMLAETFPGAELYYDPLSVSIGCHIGPGAVAVGVSLC